MKLLVALLLLAGLLTGCAATSGTPRQQLNEWANAAGLDSIDAQINTDLSFFHHAISSSDLQGLKTDCEGFPGDVESLYETLPAPDETVTNEFNDAWGDWSAAALDCVDANSVHSRDYHRFITQFTAGEQAYQRALRRLSTFGVR